MSGNPVVSVDIQLKCQFLEKKVNANLTVTAVTKTIMFQSYYENQYVWFAFSRKVARFERLNEQQHVSVPFREK